MSNSLAIAAVSATLRQRLLQALAGTDGNPVVSMRPPGQLTAAELRNRVNLYLYQTTTNSAWRNETMPGTTRSGERGHSPLALNLSYLVTAYGDDGDDSDLKAHRLLGNAMRVLHDTPMLKDTDISRAGLVGQDLAEQVERVKLIPVTLSIEEMSKLWSTFQAPYRISAAYEASVVLIESQRAARAVMPVLKRGREDRGIETSAGFGPVLQGVEYLNPGGPAFPSAEPGESIAIVGSDLPADVEVLVRDPRQPFDPGNPEGDIVAQLRPDQAQSTPERLVVPLSRDGASWTPGMLTLELARRRPAADGDTAEQPYVPLGNPLPLLVSPVLRLDPSEAPTTTIRQEEDRRLLEVELIDAIAHRHVSVVLLTAAEGELSYQAPREVLASNLPEEKPLFDVTQVPLGTYRLRVRVDGVDSRLFASEVVQNRAIWQIRKTILVRIA